MDVWRASLSAATGCLAALDAVLSPAERRRADRGIVASGRRRSVVSRGLLRHMLGRYLGTQPDEVAICLADHGRPFVRHPLQFSVTHSGDVVAYAFCLGARVGLDTERVDAAIDVSSLAGRVFSERELRAFGRLGRGEKVGTLFAAWTRKEALLKAFGTGLTEPMGGIELPVRTGSRPLSGLVLPRPGVPGPCCVSDVALWQGYAAAVATEGAIHHAVAVMDIPMPAELPRPGS